MLLDAKKLLQTQPTTIGHPSCITSGYKTQSMREDDPGVLDSHVCVQPGLVPGELAASETITGAREVGTSHSGGCRKTYWERVSDKALQRIQKVCVRHKSRRVEGWVPILALMP